ncbi:polymorphic toxin type 15 domain-containing protein [Pseudomonas sp.]|uniref:polymorphic toxin type 15 domain-containing protein n=1 Tax=Pseudomonas sp. TaxID=306 RepID=UPI0028A907F0|nr:polymorphic toxin type 15 domain-containing protein [Pseudomonas sp.]
MRKSSKNDRARTPKKLNPLDAELVAVEKSKNRMSVLAALHNPGLMAGDRDIISDFGDRQVNSTIGPQWKSKLPNLKKAAEKIPLELRSTTRMNTKLHKC